MRCSLRSRTACFCVARATCPVLVIPPTELAQEMDRHLLAWLIKRRALTPHKER